MSNRCLLLDPPDSAPTALYDLLRRSARGYKTVLALRAVLRAGMFDLADRPRSVAEWARALNLEERILSPVCELLAEAGVLERREPGYCPAPWTRTWLAQDGPLCQEAVVENVVETCGLWGELERALRRGPLDPWKEGLFGGSFLPALGAESLVGEAQRSAALVAQTPGFDQVRDLADLGGGHGLYSLALCARCPELHAEVLDLPGAKAQAEAWTARFASYVQDGNGGTRVRFTPTDIFADPLGEERDAVLLFYNPGGKNPHLLERIHDCLRPGGLFVSKHAFYRREEGSKDPLSDVEWNMTAFPGVEKGPHVYWFAEDLCREEYMERLDRGFEVLAEYEADAFASPDLGKFGDRLDSRMIICRKR